nr:hypothetical protein [uncultured Mediterranean phage uvMED]
MNTEITNLSDGTVRIEVCEDGICAMGWVTSHHLVQPKEQQLKESIRLRAAEAYAA